MKALSSFSNFLLNQNLSFSRSLGNFSSRKKSKPQKTEPQYANEILEVYLLKIF